MESGKPICLSPHSHAFQVVHVGVQHIIYSSCLNHLWLALYPPTCTKRPHPISHLSACCLVYRSTHPKRYLSGRQCILSTMIHLHKFRLGYVLENLLTNCCN